MEVKRESRSSIRKQFLQKVFSVEESKSPVPLDPPPLSSYLVSVALATKVTQSSFIATHSPHVSTKNRCRAFSIRGETTRYFVGG